MRPEALPDTRMDRKDDRYVTRHILKGVEKPQQDRWIVHIGRAMQREHGIGPIPMQVETVEHGGVLPAGSEGREGVDHDVADDVDLVSGDPFTEKIFPTALLRDEEPVGDRIRQQAVDLLRHGAVEASKSGLHVRHRNPELDRGDRRSEEHTSELQSLAYLVCRLLLEKKKKTK